jgi:glycosyltransferase involved in cell wall biosynthesis
VKVVVVASLAWSLVNFRGALLASMVAHGHEVVACAPEDDPEVREALAAMGVTYRQVPMQRASISPVADLVTLVRMIGLLRRERPDVILAYTQKPIVYAGLAARLASRGRFHAMVSGLGYAFTEGGGLPRRVLRSGLARLYGAAVRRATSVIVFNRDDRQELMRHGIVTADHRVIQVPGSGIDIDRFRFHEVERGPPTFLLVARLLRDKGLQEFVAAARMVRSMAPQARFRLLGPFDPNPNGISRSELAAWEAEGIVDYLGETRDVAPYMAEATVIVLPSRYREGLPRTLLEAMAIGRAIITTDAPGCRETVDGNGFLVPVGSVDGLADAMMNFVCDPALATRMGRRSRELAEDRFAVHKVNAKVLDVIGLDHGPAARPGQQPAMVRAVGSA